MRRFVLALGLTSAATCTTLACVGVDVDVGNTVPPPTSEAGTQPGVFIPDAGTTPDKAVAPNSVFARCGQGKVDLTITNANALFTSLTQLGGSWVECPGEASTPLPCVPNPPVRGIRFREDGTFVLLAAESDTSPTFIEVNEECAQGTFKIWWPYSNDAGPTGDGEAVSFADTTTRNGLQLHLSATGESGPFVPEEVRIERDPELMSLAQVGAKGSNAYFAPILRPSVP